MAPDPKFSKDDCEMVSITDGQKVRVDDVHDGDLALKTLNTHFEPYTAEEEKRVCRKIDYRLASVMLLVNGIQFVDKLTISQAATYGLVTQAHLVGQEFSLLISIFYIGYFVASYPTSYLMQRYPLGKYLTINFILWGIVLAAMGSCKSFAPFMAARFFLGVFESCLNPGFILITSSFWKREEQPLRVALWYCANGVISIPAGFIFFGVAHVQLPSMFPYQLMFLIFGAITIVLGVGLWFTLPDSPMTARWLNERERLIAVERLRSNKTGIKNEHHKAVQVKEALLDYRVWMLVLGVFLHNMTNSLQTTFQGLIIRGLGYSVFQAVLLSLPTAAIFGVSVLGVSALLSTKYGEGKRILAIIICYIPGIVSCVILLVSPLEPSTSGFHLFAVYFVGICATSAGLQYSLLASNVAGYTKKTVAGAMFFISYCVSNIVGPQTWIESQAPTYVDGVAVSLGAFCLNILLFAALYLVYSRENKKRDRLCTGQDQSTESQDLVEAFSDMTDRENLKFRYKM